MKDHHKTENTQYLGMLEANDQTKDAKPPQTCLPLPVLVGWIEQENGPLIREYDYPIACVCAWCKRDLPVRDFGPTPGLISHGICNGCAIETMQSAHNDKIIQFQP